MEDLKLIVAKNIAELRKSCGMTQFELAEKLNYSDKAVSKWERGESIPDVAVLKQIADIFSVTVDYMLAAEHRTKRMLPDIRKINFSNHSFITGMSIMLVWLIATLVFVIGDMLREYTGLRHWLVFLFAVPVTLIVWLVFNSIWFNARRNFFIISLLMWSVFVTLHISLIVLAGINMRLIYILGVPAQIIIILWSRIKTKMRQQNV